MRKNTITIVIKDVDFGMALSITPEIEIPGDADLSPAEFEAAMFYQRFKNNNPEIYNSQNDPTNN